MTEQEFINTSDLADLRSALSLISNIYRFDCRNGDAIEACYISIKVNLREVIEDINKQIKIEIED